MRDVCGSEFWDYNLTWKTDTPYFTLCFEELVLVLGPVAFILIGSVIDVWLASKGNSSNRRRWKFLSFDFFKVLMSAILICVSINNIIEIQLKFKNAKLLYSAAPGGRILAYLVSIALVEYGRYKGIVSSGVQFFYWFISLLCEIVLFRTAVDKRNGRDVTLENTIYLFRFIYFPLVVVQFFLNCWSNARKVDDDKQYGKPSPEKNASFLNKLTFVWYDYMAWLGYKKPLESSDLWDLNKENTTRELAPAYDKLWTELREKVKKKNEATGKNTKANILYPIIRIHGATFLFSGFLKLIFDLMAFISPELLKLVVAHVSSTEGEQWKGFLYAGCMFAVAVIQSLIHGQYSKRMMLIGLRMRSALTAAVYKKALIVSSAAKKDSSVGEIVNLMSVDTQRFVDLLPMIHLLWASPVQIALATYFLYNSLGASSLAGVGIMILLIPATGVLAMKVRTLQMEQMVLKDKRVKLMSEILGGIKVLKLYGWEKSFQKLIEKFRTGEIKLLTKAMYLNSSTVFVYQVSPFLVSIGTFAVYVLTDENNVLNAEKTFVALTLFNIMRMPLTLFPMVLAMVIQASVSVKRLNKYMNLEEMDLAAVTHEPDNENAISIKNGSFTWTEFDTTLSDINVDIKKGSLVAVVGQVGCGKSSLLSAMIGEMKVLPGSKVNTVGTISYVSQNAWIQNASLKNNILFGDIFSDKKYKTVIDCCALESDLELLPGGDETEIGEKGINLSGGQKQRVALARAAYKKADIVLLDDPLSAVDAHVGKHLFEKLISNSTGYLKDSTRVFVTHGINYLPKVDHILVMKDGKISESGTYRDLLIKNGAFAEFIRSQVENADDEELDESVMHDLEEVVPKEIIARRSSSSASLKRLSSKSSTIGLRQRKKQNKEEEVTDVPDKNKLISEETTEKGNIHADVIIQYLKSAGIWFTFNALFFNILFQAASAYANIWLSDWSDEATEEEEELGKQNDDTTVKYLSVYGALGAAQAIAILLGTITLGLGVLKSAVYFHSSMLERILRSPMSYFDTTPVGRLVNRFSKDVDTADLLLPQNIRGFLNLFLSVLSTVIVISYSTPIFIGFIVPVAILYFFLQRFYVSTSRQLRRMESVSRSPIYSHFGETISGATTIRAFALQDEFITESEKRIDFNQKTYAPFIASNLWISVRLESLAGLITLAAALFAVIGRDSGISPGTVGLSISYALQITQLLTFAVRISTDLETNVVSIERMMEITGVPQEASWEVESHKPEASWPSNGEVVFRDYQTRYREGLDLVLKGITCNFKPGEKIGIVGRTGAGKSSMTLALFRIVEPAAGQILIDGVDISKIGLHDLRSKLTIIPQDPVLFSGTLRLNLDPFQQFDDERIWNCLEQAHLKNYVKTLPEGLDYTVAEEGQNFSVGQRQLICLARALLRKTKILVLDEATAAVDLETDDLIQKTIRTEFKDSTVITIAHRINTIMDSHRVLVLDAGKITEFDSPSVLLGKPDSLFYGLAKQAGINVG